MVERLNFHDYFEEGETIYGFCNGYFGRDDYSTKEVIYVCNNYIILEYVNEDRSYAMLQNDDFMDRDGKLKTLYTTISNIKENCVTQTHKQLFDEWKVEEEY